MFFCPYCGSSSHTRAKKQEGKNEEKYYQCQNFECSATFVTTERLARVARPPISSRKQAPKKTRRHSKDDGQIDLLIGN
ncbi:ogr/Delta-like zinc finger family protein [Escherichia coli]|nr:ogr/Delta-like zinc finger family protein [Escherichia coli]